MARTALQVAGQKSSPASSCRRRFGFSLRTLLALVTLSCLWFGWQTYRAQLQRDAVEAISALGGTIAYDCEYDVIGRVVFEPPKAVGPKWLRQLIGRDYFDTVVEANLSGAMASDQAIFGLFRHLLDLASRQLLELDLSSNATVGDQSVALVWQLESLSALDLAQTEIIDRGMAHLTKFRNLRVLALDQTTITDQALGELKNLARLEHLGLQATRVTDDGMHHLVRLRRLRQ
jgi:hypothetical protein